MSLSYVPISLKLARAFVAAHHSHHGPPQGGKFALGVKDGSRLCAVAVVGRPVARHLDDGVTAEVTRLCTDGTRHAASMAINQAKRAAQAMGYRRVITYTLRSESGTSLIAGGWTQQVVTQARSWSRPKRGRTDKHPTEAKVRWSA